MSRFPNLPRIELVTVDGQLVPVIDRPRTDSVLIIAPAVDGPTDQIVRVNDAAALEQIFGPITFNSEYSGPNGETEGWNGNALMKAMREVLAGGGADIRLLRVLGAKAQSTHANTATGADGDLAVAARNAGRIYNRVKVEFQQLWSAGAVVGGYCIVKQPSLKGGTFTVAYTGSLADMTVREMIQRVNSHPANRTVRLALPTAGGVSPTALARNLRSESAGVVAVNDLDDLTALDVTIAIDGAGAAALADHDLPFYVQIDDEVMKVTAATAIQLTVVRAQRGSTAAIHLDDAAITVLDDHTLGVSGETPVAGTDGTERDTANHRIAYYDALVEADTGTFALIEDHVVDVIYLAGICVDDLVEAANYERSIVDDFHKFLGRRSVEHPIIGVIGVRPIPQLSPTMTEIKAHFEALVTPLAGQYPGDAGRSQAGYFMHKGFLLNEGELSLDAGAYMQVVAADGLFNDRDLGLYVGSLAGIYAGVVAALRPHIPATHAPVSGILGLPYEFSRQQLDKLTGGMGQDTTLGLAGGAAYVTVRRYEEFGPLFTKDVTAAQRRSDFKNLQVLRIANEVHKQVKKIAFPFLGKPNDIPHRNALEQGVKQFLNSLAEAEALAGGEGRGFQLQIGGGQSSLQKYLGVLDIQIMLRPALQIQAINIRVRMAL